MWETRNAYQIFVEELSIPLLEGDVGNNIKIYFRSITPFCRGAGGSGQGPYCRTGV